MIPFKTLLSTALLTAAQSLSYAQFSEMNHAQNKITYPSARRDETVVDDYHGTKLADPYRWMEDDHSEETKAWVKAENAVTFNYLDKIPFRATLKNRLEKKLEIVLESLEDKNRREERSKRDVVFGEDEKAKETPPVS